MSINLKRREFLLGAAKLGLSMPTIQMLLQCENALAEVNNAHPDSLVLMYTSNGNRRTFEPPKVDTFSSFTSLGANIKRAPLSALSLPDGSLSPVISNSFNMSHIGVIRGVDWPGKDESGGGEHNPGAVTTGSSSRVYYPNSTQFFTFPTEPSIDQIISPYLGNTPLGVVTAMAGPENQGGGFPFWSYKRAGDNAVSTVESESRPDVLYKRITDNIVVDPTIVNRIKTKRITVANLIHEQFTLTLNSGKKVLSKKDKSYLEQHLALIQDQQKNINAMTSNACTVTAAPNLTLVPVIDPITQKISYYTWTHDQVFNRLKAQIDNWILARMCGLSRVLVLHIGEADLLDIGTGDNHHGLSHYTPDANWNAKKLPIEKGYMEVFAYLVNRLNTVYDTDSKTLLEKTLCVFNNSAGTNADGVREGHLAFNYPIVVASRHPSIKAVGYYLDYQNHSVNRYTSFAGAPYIWGHKLGVQLNRFFVTIAEAMGLTPQQYLSPVTSTIGQHQNNDFNQYDDAKINVPLEGFL